MVSVGRRAGKAAWKKLPGDIQSVIAAANAAVSQQVLSEFMARNNASLRVLINEQGVTLKKFPVDVLRGLAGLSEQVMNDPASRDRLSRKVMDSMLGFRKDVSAWTAIAETATSEARFLQDGGAAPGNP